MKRVLSIIGNILLTIFIVVEIGLIVSLAFFRSKDEAPSILGFRIYVVATGSMEPEIHVGDMIIDRVYKDQEIKVGDVITYQGTKGEFAGKTVTHEVINVDEKTGYITTQGIANNSSDPPITKDQIEGILVFKTTIAGKIYGFLMKPVGFIFAIVLPMVVFIMYEAISLAISFKTNQIEEEKKEE